MAEEESSRNWSSHSSPQEAIAREVDVRLDEVVPVSKVPRARSHDHSSESSLTLGLPKAVSTKIST